MNKIQENQQLNNIIDKINKIWKEDPKKAIVEKLIMTTICINKETGELEEVILKDNNKNIIIDNRKYLKNSDGHKFKNYNYKKTLKLN